MATSHKMFYSEGVINIHYPYDDIQTLLLTRLSRSREEFPAHFSKPIYVLAVVDNSERNQLKHLLRKEHKDHKGERIILIPYNFGNSRWIGILLEFRVNGHIKRAEYIDPINRIDIVPDIIQNQFTRVYIDNLLQIRNLLKHNDPRYSTTLTVENLLIAAENIQISDIHNDLRIYELERKLSAELRTLHISEIRKLPEKIEQTKEQIQAYQKVKRTRETTNEIEHLHKLEGLHILYKEIEHLKLFNKIWQENLKTKHFDLKQHLSNNLSKLGIQDVTMLQEKIKQVEQQVNTYIENGKRKEANKEIAYLRELEELQRASEEFDRLKSVVSDSEMTDRLEEISTIPINNIDINDKIRKKDDLKNLNDELINMPSCAEKSIIELMIYFEDHIHSQEQNSVVNSLLHTLKEQINRQELSSEEIQNIFQNLNESIHKNDNLSTVKILSQLLNKIRPLNLQEIQRLLGKAEKAADLIRDKDIILLVGETGSGKSTTIQFLAGSTMQMTRIEVSPGKFLDHIEAVTPILNPQLKNITNSPLNRSETQSIVPVTIQLKEIFGSSENEVMILCDTPSFSSTTEAEIDIVNSLEVIEALKGCRSIKILALSSYNSRDNQGQDIQKLAHILVKIINGIQDKLHAVVYAFTKYPPKTDIHALLLHIQQSTINKNSDNAFMTILSDMINKTVNSAHIIDPIRSNRKILIEALQRIHGIQYPGEIFRYSMNKETQISIIKQIEKDKLNIISAMKNKDNELIKYYLDNLKLFKDLIRQNIARDTYEDSIRLIIENIDNYTKDIMKKFNNNLDNQNGFQEQNIHDYKIYLQYIKHAQILNEHLRSNLISPEAFIQNIDLELKKRNFLLEKEDLHSPLIKIYLDNFYILKKSFQEFELHYNNTCKILLQRYNELIESIRISILSNNFKYVTDNILFIYKSLDYFQNHLNIQIEEKYLNIMKYLLQYLNSFSDKIDPILVKIQLNNNDIEILRNSIEILRIAIENTSLQDRIYTYREFIRQKNNIDRIYKENFKDLNDIHNEFIEKILKYFNEINIRIEDRFKKLGQHALEDIEKLVDNIETIRIIPEIESKIAGIYYRIIENIREYIQQLQKDIEQSIINIDQQSNINNYRYLTSLISRLKNAKWINRINPGAYDNLMSRITEELVHYANQLENRLIKLDFTLKYPENVSIAYEIIEKFESLNILEYSIPQLEKYRIKSFHRFVQVIQDVFDYIQKFFNLQDESVYQIKQELKELEQIKRDYDNLHPARIYLRNQEYLDIDKLNQNIEDFKIKQKLDSIERLESIKKQYDLLMKTHHNDSFEQINFLREKGQNNGESLNQTISEKRRILIQLERNKQNYDFNEKLDASTANKALIYIEHCEKVNYERIKETVNDTNRNLQKYLREYGDFINQEISRKFKQISNIHTEGDIFQLSLDLEMRLQELSSLTKFKHVLESINGSEKIEYWQKIFFDYHRTITNKMEECKINENNKQLKDLLVITQALRCLDIFCANVFHNNGFESLYRQYQVEITKGSKAAYKTLLEYISKEDYANTHIALIDIDDNPLSAKELAQIKHDLQSSLNKLMKDTKSMTNWLDGKIEREENNRSQIREIKENIDKIRIAFSKHNIINFLDNKIKNDLENFDNDINDILSRIILKGLESIEAFIDVDNFSEAEQGMENLSRVQRELSGYCTSNSVIKKSQQLRERLTNIINQILEYRDFTDINKYCNDPPKDLLMKLKLVASHGNAKYSQAYTSMLAKIRFNFNRAIDDARNTSIDQRSEKIRSLNYALYFLPEELQVPFKSQLESLTKLFTDEEKIYTRQLDELFKIEDENNHTINKLGQLAQQYSQQNMTELFQTLHEKILKKLYQHRLNIENSLDNQDMQSAIAIIKIIEKYRESLGYYIPEIEGVYNSICHLIIKSFENSCEILSNISTEEQTQIVEKAFTNTIIFLDFSNTLDKQIIENVLHKCIDGYKKISQYLYENSEKYKIVLNDININELYKVIILSKRWDNLLQKINQCQSKHNLIKKFLQDISYIISYNDMIYQLEKEIEKLTININTEFINDNTIKFEKIRDEFFNNLSKSFNILNEIYIKFKDIFSFKFDIKKLEEDLKKKVEKLGEQLITISSKRELSLRDSDHIRIYYNHLISFNKYIHLSGLNIQYYLQTSEENIYEKIRLLRKEILNSNSNIIKVSELLIEMKFLSENLLMFDKKINEEIDEVLRIYKEKQGISSISQLSIILEKTDIGNRLISEHSSLAGEDLRKRREKMQKQDDLEYILNALKGDDIDKDILCTCYYIFREKYDELLSIGLTSFNQKNEIEPNLDILVTQTKLLIGTVSQNLNSINWNKSFKNNIPELLAYIFAIWTLKHTQHYNEMRGIEASRAYLLMPHVGQIISIFRILGIGYENNSIIKGYNINLKGKISDDLINNLVEIGTGEGKSVVMAVTACVFALIGIDVNCSCYSEVLSLRDKNDFSNVFQILEIEERIEYGTFNKLCEQLLNEQCDVRENVRYMILNNKNRLDQNRIKKQKRLKVLLIDEVDVFLSDKYYGGMYTPSVYIKDPLIKILLDTLWQNKTTLKNFNTIKTTIAYKNCITQYSNWSFLFDEAIKDMLLSLKSFRSSTYIIQNDRIVYIEGESVADNVVCGYDTIWAYYYENEKGNISENSLNNNVGIIVNCGIFSYAEMPHDFAYITGVTGTLTTLAQSEKDILETVYSVYKNTYIPSVFGKSNRNYNSTNDVRVVDESEYFMTIRGEIDVICNANRAILVFFESENRLMEFYNSTELFSIKENIQIITEKVSVKDREFCIKRAATEGRITLLTRIFGRGTDFICRNQQLLANGGIHVLQTFFSEELSEEYQIMGRGARQGDRGSYRMILLDSDLEWVIGSNWKKELPKISGSILYKTLNTARNARYESKCGAKKLSIEQCKNEHESSKNFMNALIKGDIDIVKRFLFEQNRGANLMTTSSRTVLLMDATGSMSSLLSAAKETVCTMFERASAILDEQGISNNAFQMQFAIYRNYNSRENKILQVSSWETKGNHLRAFMNTISSEGGLGEEAIEIGLWHAVRESQTDESISQVILIGDAPTNTQEQVHRKRARFGESYWNKTIFHKPTYYEYELQKLIDKNIPVHTFYLDNSARNNFQKIANETGGRCEKLNINSSEGAEYLTDYVTEEILRKTAGAQGDSAVELYRRTYVRTSFIF